MHNFAQNNLKKTLSFLDNTIAKIYNFNTKTLKNGSNGEAAKELQRFLNAKLSLGLVVDGMLGPKTKTMMNSLVE